MARRGAELDRPVRYSVFDRLLLGDDDTLAPGESDEGRLRDFVLRDLRWLLNTRQTQAAAMEGYPELQRSTLGYGFVDINSLGRDSQAVRTRLISRIEETLALFEPRLTSLRVSIAPAVAGMKHQIRFMIQGTLRADPLPIAFAFDTVIDKLKGEVNLGEPSAGSDR